VRNKPGISSLRPTDKIRLIATLLLFSSVFSVFQIGSNTDQYRPPVEAIVHGLSYYTVVGNGLLSLESVLILLGWPPAARPGYHGCAVYSAILMFIVCLSLDLGSPGWSNFSPDLVIAHILNPLLAACLSWKAGKPIRYRVRDVFILLLPAFLWVVFVQIRGPLSGEYPYFWIDPNAVGVACMYQNLFWLCGTAIFVAFAFVAFSQFRFVNARKAMVNGAQRRWAPSRRAAVAIRSRLRDRDIPEVILETSRSIVLTVRDRAVQAG
jgi:hypothetical protein